MASGEWGPVQSRPRRARFFDGGGDDLGVLAAEEIVLAGVRVEAANSDLAGRPSIRCMASAPSSMVRTMRSWSRRQACSSAMWVETWTVASLSLASSMRDSVAPQSSAMYSVWPEKWRPERRDGFLVERGGDHGVGFACEAHFGGKADVLDCGDAVFGGELAEAEGLVGSRRPGETRRMVGARRSR